MSSNKKEQSPSFDHTKAILADQFDQLEREAELPPDLKSEVFKTIETFALMTEVVELFTNRFCITSANLLSDKDSTPLPDEQTEE